MTSINTNSGSGSNYNNNVDNSNISISKLSGHEKVDKNQAIIKDQISIASNYQEEYVPPSNSPQLAPENKNPKTDHPPMLPGSPNNFFGEQLLKKMLNLTNGQFSKLLQSNPQLATKEQAANLLKFAFEHPNDPNVSGDVKELLQQLVKQTADETKSQYKLGDAWKPPAPDVKKADQQLSKELEKNFDELVNKYSNIANNSSNKSAQINPEALKYANAHPETASSLPPAAQKLLQTLQQTAKEMTQEQNGLPTNSNIPQPGSKNYDQKLTQAVFEKFSKLVQDDQKLTDPQKAQLTTLFFDKEANVPDKTKLLPLEKQLEQKAMTQLNLPQGAKLPNLKDDFHKAVQKQFEGKFAENAAQTAKELNLPKELKELLLGTNGMNPNNLPANLKQIFQQIKAATINQIIGEMGLPKDWQPKNTIEEKVKASETKKEGGKEGVKETSKSDNKTFGILGDGTAAIQGQKLQEESISLSKTEDVNIRGDAILAANVYNQYKEMNQALNKFGNHFISGPDKVTFAASMFIVGLALDQLRTSNYHNMETDSTAAQTKAKAQEEINEAKIQKQKEQMEKQKQDHPKEFFLFKIFDAIPGIGDVFKAVVENTLWMVDIITGGAISMMAKALNMEPITRSLILQDICQVPDSAMEHLNMALQMVAMVAMMLASAVLCQPELIAGEVAMMTAEISEAAGQAALHAGELAAREAAASAVEIASQTGAGATREAIAESMEAATKQITDVIKTNMQATLEQSLAEAATKGASPADLEIIQNAVNTGAENMAKELVDNAYKQAITEGVAGTSESIAASLSTTVQESAAQMGANVGADLADRASEIATRAAIVATSQGSGETSSESGVQASMNAAQQEVSGVLKEGMMASMPAGLSGEALVAAEKTINETAEKLAQKMVEEAFTQAGRKQLLKLQESIIQAMSSAISSLAQAMVDGIKGAVTSAVEAAGETLGVSSKGGTAMDESVQTMVNTAKRAASKEKFGNLLTMISLGMAMTTAVTAISDTASGAINLQKALKQEEFEKEMGKLKADIAILSGETEIMKKSAASFLTLVQQTADWINQINKDQAKFLKNMEIRFIAA